MKIDGNGQRKTKRGVCFRAHGKQAVPIEFKLSRGKGELLTGLWHDDLAHRYLRAIPAWQRGLLDGLRHGDLAHRCFRGILAESLWVGVSDSSPFGLHEIHLARAIIDYQVVSDPKGAR